MVTHSTAVQVVVLYQGWEEERLWQVKVNHAQNKKRLYLTGLLLQPFILL